MRCKLSVARKVALGRNAPTEVPAHGLSLHLAPSDGLIVKRERTVERFDHCAGSCLSEGETRRGAEADVMLVGVHDRISKAPDVPYDGERAITHGVKWCQSARLE